MTTTSNTITNDSLTQYIEALRNYDKTGFNQSKSILATLKKSDLSISQINEIQPGSWLRLIEKTEPADEDEKEFKEGMQELLKGLNKKFNNLKEGSGLKQSKGTIENTEGKENQNVQNIEDNTNEREKDHALRENILREQEEEITKELPQAVRDFTVKNLAQGLLLDYKNDAKKEAQPIATEKATEIEKIIRQESKEDPESYRMEARNVSNFLLTKNNENLREGILHGEIDPQKFVYHKEDFLNTHAKEVVEENEKRHYMDVNADFDRKMVPESAMYTCENCGSKRVQKTEKQMNASDRSSSTVLICAECETVKIM